MRRTLPVLALLAVATAAWAGSSAGKELFLRTWLPWDSRASAGGDGLGPMYNAASCAACHNQGALGGGGTKEHNVRLAKTSDSPIFVVDHRLSTLSPRALPSSGGSSRAERNTPALFGSGVIDAIPESALVTLEAAQKTAGGVVSGRVPRTAEGKVGKFGWKAHTATLDDFVATACANELGLSVSGHKQGAPPPGDLSERLSLMQQALSAYGTERDLVNGPGIDMTDKEVAALTSFVRGLPAPIELTTQPRRDAGVALLKSTGCDTCHAPNVASAKGIYSDLLLHDMGQRLADGAGSYQTRGSTPPPMASATPPDEDSLGGAAVASAAPGQAEATEWRTPPLWGVRDSGPYLHDGRAPTLDEAVRQHEGEGADSVKKYLELPITEQQLLISFLESLAAPDA